MVEGQGFNAMSIMQAGKCVQVEMRWDNRFKPVHSACGCKMRICRKTLQEALDMPMGSTSGNDHLLRGCARILSPL